MGLIANTVSSCYFCLASSREDAAKKKEKFLSPSSVQKCQSCFLLLFIRTETAGWGVMLNWGERKKKVIKRRQRQQQKKPLNESSVQKGRRRGSRQKNPVKSDTLEEKKLCAHTWCNFPNFVKRKNTRERENEAVVTLYKAQLRGRRCRQWRRKERRKEISQPSDNRVIWFFFSKPTCVQDIFPVPEALRLLPFFSPHHRLWNEKTGG